MYSFQDKVRYSEVDRHGKLSIPAVVNYLQDCSTFQSEALGVGIEHLKKVHRAWLLTSWQIDLLEDMHIGEDIKVGTWSYSAKGVYGYRNFVIRTLEDRPLVNADSLWVFVDTESGKPVKVTPEDIDDVLDFASVDVSFISLTKVLPAAYALLKDGGQMVCLIKPQFEAGREKVGKKGVVRDKAVHEEVIERIITFALENGFSVHHLEYSPIKGPEGNIEYLVHIEKSDEAIKEESVDIHAVVEAAHGELDK